MGLAASQARLLTITARLADNELRSQTINNAKMRLATQSAQASDEYVSALNCSQMMFNNTTDAGLAQTQALTFNALTQFSQYNNQYGLVNSSGQILVSEEEDKYFKAHPHDLEGFLKAHNLEWETTFFDETSGDLQAKLTSFYDSSSTDFIAKFFKGKSNDDLKNLYLNAISQEASIEYQNYQTMAETYYSVNMQAYKDAVLSWRKIIFGETDETQIAEALSSKDISDIITELNGYYKDSISSTESTESTEYIYKQPFDSTGAKLDEYKKSLMTYQSKIGGNNYDIPIWGEAISGNREEFDGLSLTNLAGVDFLNVPNNYTLDSGDKDATMTFQDAVWDGTGTETGTGYALGAKVSDPDTDNSQIPVVPAVTSDGAFKNFLNGLKLTYEYEYKTAKTDADGNLIKDTDGNVEYETKKENYIHEYRVIGSTLYKYEYLVDPSSEIEDKDKDGIKENDINAYIQDLKKQFVMDFFEMLFSPEYFEPEISNPAAEDFENTYGFSITINDTKYLKDFDALVKDGKYKKADGSTAPAFQSVLDVYYTQKMVDVLGEPKFAWVDKSANPTDNPDAKAQWLTNLFNRMQKGYKVLENGLASSKDWIEYAFNSGLVSMEQVDKSQNWLAIDYKSCANIFEETDNSTAVAMAEAKYNRAMNDIKQKDSMYDLELKNIDTEHSSLQTEYDVIKGVINKNIERTMKFNQSA